MREEDVTALEQQDLEDLQRDGLEVATVAVVERPLTPQQRLLLRYYACGLQPKEIHEKTGYSLSRISVVVNSSAGKAYLENVYKELDAELKSLYNETIQVVRKGLRNADPSVNLAAAALWFKTSGKMQQSLQVNVTAEDVVQRMMQEEKEHKPHVGQIPDSSDNRTLISDTE